MKEEGGQWGRAQAGRRRWAGNAGAVAGDVIGDGRGDQAMAGDEANRWVVGVMINKLNDDLLLLICLVTLNVI